MKYGVQLPSRSVAEWRAHNILYNDIRDTITQETSGNLITADGYNTIFSLLNDEYQNVNLFVKSKLGEIEQRLRTCQRLVAAISSLDSGSRNKLEDLQSTSEMTRDTNIYQLQCEVAKVSRDVQHLSRFAGAQFTGFRKLIKKFRKLAPKDGPQLHEFERLLNGSESFASIDFTSIFLELSLLYDMIRSGRFSPFKSLPPWTLNGPSSKPLETRLCQFDVRMVSTPAKTIYYWIHSEDIVQVQVSLLQNLSLLAGSDHSQVTRTTFYDDEEFDCAVRKREPAQTCQVELLENGDVSAKSRTVFCAPTGGIRHFCAATLSSKVEHKLYTGALTSKDLDSLDNNAKFALGWALSRQIKPRATVVSSRLRYETNFATTDAEIQHVWAVIDSDLVVQNCRNSLSKFPYHVLQIRFTGQDAPKWLEDMGKSHLMHPVSESFSSYHYALYLAQNKKVFWSSPSWAKILEKGEDIRKAPKPARQQRSKRSTQTLRRQSGSSSGGAGGGNILLNDTTANDSTRYWNEFDNPEDEDDENAFSVFVNDEDEELVRMMRAEALSQPLMKFSQTVRRSVRHVKQLLGLEFSTADEYPSNSPCSSETQSLLGTDRLSGTQYSPRLIPTDIGPDLETDNALVRTRLQHRENMMMAMLTTVCLTLAAIIDVMVYAILLSEDVEDLVVGAQVVLVVGLLLSAILATLGAMAFGLHNPSNWPSQVCVHGFWFAVMCFGVGGISWIVTT